MSYPFNLALSSCGKAINEDLFKAYAENNIEAIEISLTYDDCETFDFEEARRLSEKYNVKLHSFHIPFAPFELIDISKPELAPWTIELVKKYITQGAAVGIKYFVIHPSGEPIPDDTRAERLECSKASLCVLAEFAKSLGCVIAVEDLPRSCLGNCSADILSLISAHPDLGVCFDTNHLLGEDIVEFIGAVGSRIVTTHVSDYDYINERHWLPGEGMIDWSALCSALDDAGYRGYWLYEIGFDTPWSIDRSRFLTCADFKNNFDEIVCGKKPTPIGTPKANLGMWGINK